MLLNMYMAELTDEKTKKKKLANAYNLDFVMKAIANAQKGQRQALCIDKENSSAEEPEIRIISGINLNDI